MASPTNIEWTDFNWNFLSGCSRKSSGCENCYAEKMTKRLAAMGQAKYQGLLNDHGRFNGTIKFNEKDLLAPLKWKKPRKVFVNSMSDLFHEKVKDEWLDKAFAVMALTPQHTYQILTKRPERMWEYFKWHDSTRAMQIEAQAASIRTGLPAKSLGNVQWQKYDLAQLKNVWLGVSVEDQKTADERIPLLLQTPAAVRWISAEPLLGPVEIATWLWSAMSDDKTCGLNWCVIGGESGPNARAFDIQWVRNIIAQCKAADVPVFVKQIGAKPYDNSRSDIYFDGELRHKNVPDDGEDAAYARECLGTELQPAWVDLKNKKGGDPSEWPEDLRIRQMPETQQ